MQLPPGAKVMVLFGSANRDERQYPDAEQFLVTRDPKDHLGFGAGIHLCLGAALARLEAKVALTELLSRTSNITPRAAAQRLDSFILRGCTRMPIDVTATA